MIAFNTINNKLQQKKGYCEKEIISPMIAQISDPYSIEICLVSWYD